MTLVLALIIVWCLVQAATWIKIGLSLLLIAACAASWGLARIWTNNYWAGFHAEMINQTYERVFRHYERFLKNASIVTKKQELY